ncbi:VanW family protein [Longimicrobium sp.]|uniref:VanW family protein n=1 Tax=Longimicrobium sp. TaxID=2029185 RepID=UPI002D8112E1|nr:VanW family protein [Longimicrobium sp.]
MPSPDISQPHHGVPHSRTGALVFRAKAAGLRLRRTAGDLLRGPRRHPRAAAPCDAPVLAESATPLWTNAGPGELALVAGKVHNLRLAARRIDGVELPAGAVFGFWAQVGRASRLRGFVAGRELREGCLIPSVGGGLCQLSSALYDAALRAGCEIVERHAHTRVVPGSAAELGRDATVFWNYVDLRFRAPRPLRIEARMDDRTLTVRLRGPRAAEPVRSPDAPLRVLRVLGAPPRSCPSCGEAACFRHRPVPLEFAGRTAHLLDEWSPEIDGYLAGIRRDGDVMGIPLDGRRFRKPAYAWTTGGAARVRQSWRVVLARSWRSRRLAAQGAARQRALLDSAAALAESYAPLLGWDVTHVVVAQNLLPFLWRSGHLGGRTFDVLMTAPPMAELHARLDVAARLHPASPTLADFRADEALLHDEAEALVHARRIVTPHRDVAALFPGRAEVLDWARPAPKRVRQNAGTRPRIVFPGPTAGRKGAYELREALAGMDVELVAMGSMLEGAGFWDGIRLAPAEAQWLDGADLVVLPAFVENRPRRLLQALASGVPVIATPACGLGAEDGLTLVPAGDAGALREAIVDVLAARSSNFVQIG